MSIRLSIIVPTVSRSDEFKRFLDSLVSQKHLERVELIVVDQNEDDRLGKLLENKNFGFETIYLKEKKISSSFAKNKGVEKARGEFCCFLDDDCWLQEQFVSNINNALDSTGPSEGLLMKAVTPKGEFLVPCKLSAGYILNQRNIKDAFFAPQIAHVYPADHFKKLKGFNEKLGVGTYFGSAEETDMLVRLVYDGVTFNYREELVLYHPEVSYSTMTPQKSFQYGLGFGAFCRIHGWWAYWLYKLAKSLAGSLIFLIVDVKKSRSYFQTFKGRASGFLNYSSRMD